MVEDRVNGVGEHVNLSNEEFRQKVEEAGKPGLCKYIAKTMLHQARVKTGKLVKGYKLNEDQKRIIQNYITNIQPKIVKMGRRKAGKEIQKLIASIREVEDDSNREKVLDAIKIRGHIQQVKREMEGKHRTSKIGKYIIVDKN